MRPVRLECGCIAIADHDKGERLYTCTGGGLSATDKVTVSEDAFIECQGGVRYCIRAFPSVSYEAVRL